MKNLKNNHVKTLILLKLGVKIENKDHLYEKIINENYLLKIEKDDINNYCPSSKSCNIEIKIEVVNYYDLDFQVSLLFKSSQDTIVYLNKNGFIDKRKILNKEKQYFVVETIPSVGMDLRINGVFSHESSLFLNIKYFISLLFLLLL